jgi:hypothetical protein
VHVMQYEITLPADYDMGTIRARVAARGHVFDDRAGLGLKAFVIRTRGVEGSPVNQYAPFYLWVDSGAMSHFLVGGGGFERIVTDFGRPTVHHWAAVGFETGPARGATPRAAARRLTPVSSDVDLVTLVEDEMDQLRQVARREDVHSTALALDPLRWQLVRFTLSTQSAPDTDDATERYEVLHLSTPHIADLPTGRHW